jgi:hypothetical protein
LAEAIRKLAFFEIGQGKLASETQALFEQAQIEAKERKAVSTVILKIFVGPPENQDERFGKAAYSTELRVPPHKSMVYTTELRDGVIINSGDSEIDLMQTKLELPIPENTAPFSKKGEANG